MSVKRRPKMSVKCRPDKRSAIRISAGITRGSSVVESTRKGVELLHHLFQNNITTILDLKHRRYFSQRRQNRKACRLVPFLGGINLFGHCVVKYDCREFDGVDNGFTP